LRRAPRAIRRVLALRHDAFESHLASVGEDGRAVAFDMLVKAQAKASFGQHTSKRGLADLKWITPQVVSVWLLNPLILVISAHHHASNDGLAFPLAAATSEEEGQGREDCTHDPGDGR